MVGHAGSTTGIAHADIMALTTRSKVKVKVTHGAFELPNISEAVYTGGDDSQFPLRVKRAGSAVTRSGLRQRTERWHPILGRQAELLRRQRFHRSGVRLEQTGRRLRHGTRSSSQRGPSTNHRRYVVSLFICDALG